ncbi:MAG: hypothetical protein ACLGSD_06430 [Acidobacteriota bacterium]
MTASTYAAIVVAILDAGVGAVYSAKLIRKQSHPRIATWLIFEIGVLMSLVIYFSSHDNSVVRAALNVTDAVVVTVILIALFFEQRDRGIRFSRNEQLCLAISAASVAAWMITRTAWVGFAGFQVVMTVAYAPTIESLWRWRPGRAPEPAATWATNAVAALIAVAIDLAGAHPDYVAMLYPLRAFALCMLVVALVQRWKYKSYAAVAHT